MKIKAGIVGLGRMGSFHLETIIKNSKYIDIAGVCILNDKFTKPTIENVKKQTSKEVSYFSDTNLHHEEKINIYYDYEKMVENKNIDAIFVFSVTKYHPLHIELALKHRKHVFSEKPLSDSIEKALKIHKIIQNFSDKNIFRIGYNRRFDESYRYVYDLVKEGKIGHPFLIRSYTQDPISVIKDVIRFGPNSGGQFIDMCIHDINFIKWIFETNAEQIYAIGDCYEFNEFKSWNDGDNVACLIKYQKDKYGKQPMAFLYAGRCAVHGYAVETEILGTRGMLRVASTPHKNLVEVFETGKVSTPCLQTMYERFGQSYNEEITSFIKEVYDFIFNNKKIDKKKTDQIVDDALSDIITAFSCKESFENQKLVQINWKEYQI